MSSLISISVSSFPGKQVQPARTIHCVTVLTKASHQLCEWFHIDVQLNSLYTLYFKCSSINSWFEASSLLLKFVGFSFLMVPRWGGRLLSLYFQFAFILWLLVSSMVQNLFLYRSQQRSGSLQLAMQSWFRRSNGPQYKAGGCIVEIFKTWCQFPFVQLVDSGCILREWQIFQSLLGLSYVFGIAIDSLLTCYIPPPGDR